MKRIGIGLVLLLVAAGLLWWALGRDGGPQARTINLTVINQTLEGAGRDKVIKVNQGDQVTLQVSVDEPMEVFLHGYDIEKDLQPEEVGSLQFTATIPGLHAFMVHALGGDPGSHKRVEILLGMVQVLPGQ